LMGLLSRLPQEALRNKLIANMIEDVAKERPKDKCSRYDLMNVVTATARETRDPEEKWRLEELGGEIAAGCILTPRLEFDAAAHSAVFRVSTGWSTRSHIRPSRLGFRTC